MMKELGVPVKFIKLVMTCVQSLSYSILLNELPTLPFPAKKDLRQGDPFSPFLFALSIKYLSRCMGVMSGNHDFPYHPKCERIQLTNLRFADDLLMFARAYPSSFEKMKEAFHNFFRASGLEASNERSCIYFSGVTKEEASRLARSIQMHIGTLPFRYLGVPLAVKKLNLFSVSR